MRIHYTPECPMYSYLRGGFPRHLKVNREMNPIPVRQQTNSAVYSENAKSLG